MICSVHACLPKELNSLFSFMNWEFLGSPVAGAMMVENVELGIDNELGTTTNTIHEVVAELQRMIHVSEDSRDLCRIV